MNDFRQNIGKLPIASAQSEATQNFHRKFKTTLKPYQRSEYLLFERKSSSATTSAVCRTKHCYPMTLQYSCTHV